MTPSSTASLTGTPSQSPSFTASLSQTSSLTGTQTQTRTLSATPSATLTPTETSSRSQTRTQTPSVTASGFPQQAIFDNTAKLLNSIDSANFRSVSLGRVRGVLIYWPEKDAACGPGSYALTSLAVSLAASSYTSPTVLVNLYVSNAEGQRLTLLASRAFFPTVTTTPVYTVVRC